MTAKEARKKLKALASSEVAKSAARFFKTGPGEYDEGDTFIGIKVPILRTVSREFRTMPLAEVEALLQSPIHEERHLALMILVLQIAKSDDAQQKVAFDLYLRNTQFVNIWDLVDCSAPQIVGGYLMSRSRKPLLKLAKSNSLSHPASKHVCVPLVARIRQFPAASHVDVFGIDRSTSGKAGDRAVLEPFANVWKNRRNPLVSLNMVHQLLLDDAKASLMRGIAHSIGQNDLEAVFAAWLTPAAVPLFDISKLMSSIVAVEKRSYSQTAAIGIIANIRKLDDNARALLKADLEHPMHQKS